MVIVDRLLLNSGIILQFGAEWPDAPNQGLIVGPMFFVHEAALREDGAEERTPAHYEVWQVPTDFMKVMLAGISAGNTEGADFVAGAQSLAPYDELRCLRVWLDGNIAFTDERWSKQEAAQAIFDRYLDSFAEATEAAEPGVNGGVQAQVPAPVQAT